MSVSWNFASLDFLSQFSFVIRRGIGRSIIFLKYKTKYCYFILPPYIKEGKTRFTLAQLFSFPFSIWSPKNMANLSCHLNDQEAWVACMPSSRKPLTHHLLNFEWIVDQALERLFPSVLSTTTKLWFLCLGELR